MTALDISRLVRLPNLITVALFQSLLHYALVVPYLESHGVPLGLSDAHFAILVIATVCMAAGGNAINDYFDVSADRINRPKRMVVGVSVDRRFALLCHVLLTLIGLFAGLYLAFVLRRPSLMLIFVAVPTILWFYSTHLKRMVLVGNIAVAFLIALTGYLVVSTDFAAIDRVSGPGITDREPLSHLWYLVCVYCIFGFIATLGREIIKDLEDVEGDRATKCRTLPVEMGVGYSKAVAVMVELFLVFCLALALGEYGGTTLLLALYSIFAVAVPTIALCVFVVRAKERKHFTRASLLAKVVMLAGVLSIFFLS